MFAAINRSVGEELLSLDLPMGQFKAMATITMDGPQPVGEIGRRLGISEPAASLLVGKLEERGLAARTRDEQDRRRTLVTATQAGDELASRLRQGREEQVQRWLDALTDDELDGTAARLSMACCAIVQDEAAVAGDAAADPAEAVTHG